MVHVSTTEKKHIIKKHANQCNPFSINQMTHRLIKFPPMLPGGMRTPIFSVASDASNHGSTKLFPLAVRYWTPELRLKNRVVDFYEDSAETSESIHCQITNKLKDNGLRLEMFSAYTADNASVNYGMFKSVYQKLKADNAGIIKANCMPHVMHNCVKYAGNKLDIDIECTTNKIYSHFSSSAKRTKELKSLFEFVDQDYHAVLRHVPTRWLSTVYGLLSQGFMSAGLQ